MIGEIGEIGDSASRPTRACLFWIQTGAKGVVERRVGKSPISPTSLTRPAPPDWRSGADRILAMAPVADWPPHAWERLQGALPGFMRDWAPLAAELGWTVLELFGCHPAAPYARLRMQGLALGLHDTRIIALSGNRAAVTLARHLHGHELSWHRRHPAVLAGAVPLWDLGP